MSSQLINQAVAGASASSVYCPNDLVVCGRLIAKGLPEPTLVPVVINGVSKAKTVFPGNVPAPEGAVGGTFWTLSNTKVVADEEDNTMTGNAAPWYPIAWADCKDVNGTPFTNARAVKVTMIGGGQPNSNEPPAVADILSGKLNYFNVVSLFLLQSDKPSGQQGAAIQWYLTNSPVNTDGTFINRANYTSAPFPAGSICPTGGTINSNTFALFGIPSGLLLGKDVTQQPQTWGGTASTGDNAAFLGGGGGAGGLVTAVMSPSPTGFIGCMINAVGAGTSGNRAGNISLTTAPYEDADFTGSNVWYFLEALY